jgi:hypothetical protein
MPEVFRFVSHTFSLILQKFTSLHQGAIIQYFLPYLTGTPTIFAEYLSWYKLKSQGVPKATSESCVLHIYVYNARSLTEKLNLSEFSVNLV